MDGLDFNMTDYLKFIFAFIFVLALIALVTVAARRMGFGLPSNPRNSAQRRLGIVESLNIDGKRRMVLIRRDDTEHLILLGTGTELLIENAITPPENAFSKALNEAARATSTDLDKKASPLPPQGPPLPRALRPDSPDDNTEKDS
ncbi:MAG: FliO/MopB family protein [Rhodospirillales bacterium]|nr:FliO/MopB family protein [Rhodospirillales bacterium]